MQPNVRLGFASWLLSLSVTWIASSFSCFFVCGQESVVVLKNGLAVGPGLYAQTSKVDQNGFSSIQTEQISARPIGYVDDGLRITFFNQNLAQLNADRAAPLQRIETGNAGLRAVGDHPRVQGTQGAISVTPFDPFGRRVYSLVTPKGPADVIQGITELSAAFVRVEGLNLNSDRTYIWDMRLALSAVPPDRLREILVNHADPVSAQSWLNIVALYSDAKRYLDARDVLAESIRKFPELENQRPKLKQFEQLHAKQMLDEVEIRRRAGQPRIAEELLRGFPVDNLALETKLEVDRRLNELIELKSQVDKAKAWVKQDVTADVQADLQEKVRLAVDEIQSRLSVHNINRLADYLRLRDDAQMSSDQRMALMLSGWLMGSGASESNLAVAVSAWDARQLVQQYLVTESEAERESLLDRLKAMEGGNPRLVAKMLANLPSVRPLPDQFNKHPGHYEIVIPNATDSRGFPIRYSIQLPPEYDPERRYPCVVTLHGQISRPDSQLEWWSGPYNEKFGMCLGEASRHGYVVIAPHWTLPKQGIYNYTEDEHARVLRSLRDAMRRVNIDSDRVFLSGHHIGGDAVWDMALAHPDIWAGMIAIGADCEKYATQYATHAQYVPMYFVIGAIDGVPAPLARKYTGEQLDDFLRRSKFDCLLVVYQGRGRDHFQEELPRMVEWMNLSSHVRQPPPERIDAVTSRSSDSKFWWLEINDMQGENIVNPILFKPGRATVEAAKLAAPENGLRVSSFPSKSCTLWLSPEQIDFANRGSFLVKGRRKVFDLQPNLEHLLEDVRTRADRQHPYWQKLDFPADW